MGLFNRSKVKRQRNLVIIECENSEQAEEIANILGRMQETRMLFDTKRFNQKLDRVIKYIKEDK